MEDFLITDTDDELMARLEKAAADRGIAVEEYARAVLVASKDDPDLSSPSRSDGEGDRAERGGEGDPIED